MRWWGRPGVALVAASALAGCGTGDLVVEGAPPARPYGGPLKDPDGKADAAGRALECDWGMDWGSDESEPWPSDSGGDTPEEGLAWFFEVEQPRLPDTGYRREAERDGRVLFSYDVDGRTRIAVVVAEDQPERPGWGPQSTAACDPAEFRPGWLEEKGYEVWTDAEGRRVPLSRLNSGAGSEHCGWEKAHVLGVGGGKGRGVFVRDPDGVLEGEYLSSPYDGDAEMPDDARDTGYRHEEKGWALWLTPDRETAYVRTPDGVEAWPTLEVGCA